MPVKQRDLNDPDFPHGKVRGYYAGCKANSPCPATPTCTQVRTDYDRKRRKEYVAVPDEHVMGYTATPIRRHLQAFTDKGWSCNAIAEVSGVSKDGVADVLAKRRTWVTPRVAFALMGVNETALRNSTGDAHRPAYLVRWKIGAMMANGWSMAEQSRILGFHKKTLHHVVDGRTLFVTRQTEEDINFFFDKYQDVPGHCQQAIKFAQAKGFRTPDEYTPDGTTWEDRDVIGDYLEMRRKERYDAAFFRLEVLRLSLRNRMTGEAIATTLGIPVADVWRYREDVKLKFRKTSAYVPGVEHHNEPEPGQEERVAEVLAVLREWRLACSADPSIDPYPFARKLGMMTARKWANLDKPGRGALRPVKITRKAA